MARYFKYKSPADLVDDARRLGADLPMTDDWSHLWQNCQVGGRTVGNRCCIQPMEGCDGTLDGAPDELTFRRYRRFGAGGAKLLWGEATAVSDAGRMNPRQLCLTPSTASDIQTMLADCRAAHREVFGNDDDLLLGLQLTHSGRYSFRKPMRAVADPLVDPRTIDKSVGRPVSPEDALLTDGELEDLLEHYVAAAKLSVEIGCDFVDLKQCHHYLLCELLGARTRPGSYGGSFENRTRFIRTLVQRLRAECPSLILASRFNAYDGIPHVGQGEDFVGVPVDYSAPVTDGFGLNQDDPSNMDLAEPIQLAKSLTEWGVSLLNVTMGNPYANPHHVRPAEFPPVDGYHAPEHPLLGVLRHFEATAAIQQAVPETPVVGSGYSWLQDYAMHAGAANIAERRCAFVGMGRASLSQPDFARQLQETGRMDRKRVCRTFSYCTNLMRTKDHPLGQYATGCPPFDKEVYGPLWKEVEAKRQA